MLGIIPVSLKILSDVYMYIVVVREFHSQRMQIAFCRDTHVKVSHNTRHDSTVVDRMRTAGHEISWTIGRRTYLTDASARWFAFDRVIIDSVGRASVESY